MVTLPDKRQYQNEGQERIVAKDSTRPKVRSNTITCGDITRHTTTSGGVCFGHVFLSGHFSRLPFGKLPLFDIGNCAN